MNRQLSLTRIITMLLLAMGLCFPVFGMEEEDPEAIEIFTYKVPLPEDTSGGDWQIYLAAGPEETVDYRVTLHTYNAAGEVLGEPFSTILVGGMPLEWAFEPVDDQVAAEKVKKKTVQGLEIQSTSRLSGVMWIWNESWDILNAVSINDTVAQTLYLPHIPTDFYTWQTIFSVMGVVGQSGALGNITFDYFNNSRVSGSVDAWGGLSDNGHYLGSPFRNIYVEEQIISWGKVSVAPPASDFRLTGYQTFLKMDEGLQGAAVELVAEPSSRGYFGFSQHEEWAFSEWFAFTNPTELPARIWLTLYYVPTSGEKVEMAVFPVSLPAGNRHNLILGNDLFPEIEGRPIAMEYESFIPSFGDVDDVELPVIITHLQSDMDAVALGAHGAQSKGNKSVAFMGNLFDQRLELFNPLEEEETSIELSVHYAEGVEPFAKTVNVPAGGSVSVSYGQLVEEITELLGEESQIVISNLFRIDMDSPRGLFFNKLTGYLKGDYGITNPATRFVRVEF